MAHLKLFSRASALPAGDDDDDVDIPDTILADLAGGNVSEAKGDDDDDLPDIIIWDIDGGSGPYPTIGGLPDIFIRDDDDDSAEPTPPDSFEWNLDCGLATEASVVGTIVDFPDSWDIIGEDTDSAGLGNDPGQWVPDKLPVDPGLIDPQPNTFHGTDEEDLLVGTGAHEFLFGHSGDDILSGGGGWDQLNGGDGNDTLFGDEGQDMLIGGEGDDTLTGGGDRDLFVFADSLDPPGTDTITDFTAGFDAFMFYTAHLDIAIGETGIQNVIALEGDGGAELWADTKAYGLTQVAFVEALSAAQLQVELENAVFV